MTEDVKKWRKIDQTNLPHYLTEADRCLHYMDFQSRGGYSSSSSNSLINNFKRDPKYKGQASWNYKLTAVETFAKNLIELFGDQKNLVIAFIPGSKMKGDPEYDERFDLLRSCLLKLKPTLLFEEPIVVKSSRVAAHHGTVRPKPAEIKLTYSWKDFKVKPRKLILIDDIITTGAQFRAYKDTVLEHYDDIDVIGVFWGKTFWVNDFSEFF